MAPPQFRTGSNRRSRPQQQRNKCDCHYRLLELSKSSFNRDTARANYHALMLKIHPDRHMDDGQFDNANTATRCANIAVLVLCNESLRQSYDCYGNSKHVDNRCRHNCREIGQVLEWIAMVNYLRIGHESGGSGQDGSAGPVTNVSLARWPLVAGNNAADMADNNNNIDTGSGASGVKDRDDISSPTSRPSRCIGSSRTAKRSRQVEPPEIILISSDEDDVETSEPAARRQGAQSWSGKSLRRGRGRGRGEVSRQQYGWS